MWLVPFKGRNFSGCYNQNFLWKKSNIYIMDNHRAALWCWLQHLSMNDKINYLHIDKHRDTLQSQIDEWTSSCPDFEGLSIDDYLGHIYTRSMGTDIPLFRWDNYASIFLNKFEENINTCIFATHDEGDEPNFAHVQCGAMWELPTQIDYWLSGKNDKWIVNIDLDYFFSEHTNGQYINLVSDEYLLSIFSAIKVRLETKEIACLTICLSPECCGGWSNAELMSQKIMKILDVDFQLPTSP
ncbi:UPF0489 family protein [Aliivibrio sifiae]|uniref:UPF0489 family protein n=1 Tax=Aliivibrio sifiae TaxID=566293 RepID=UPI003D14C619